MSTKQKWNQVILSKLKEGQSLEDLKTEYDSGIIMDPNIVADEVLNLDHDIDNISPWINMATIEGGDATEINSLALQALNYGANGLNLMVNESIDINSALSNVMTEYLDVRIDCSSCTKDDILSMKESLNVSKFPNVRWIGPGHISEIHITQADRIVQFKKLLPNIKLEERYDIIITLSKNLLFEIACLRALRLLLEKQGVSQYKLIARYDVEGNNELGDYNLIEKTYKVMSGIMGCADTLLTQYDGTEDARLSLNIHNVLELESGFKDVMDPVGGAYYVEKLVHEIISKVEN